MRNIFKFFKKLASNGKRLHFPIFACRCSPRSPKNLRLRLRSYAPLCGAEFINTFSGNKKEGHSTRPESDKMPQGIIRIFRPFSYSVVSAYHGHLPVNQETVPHYILPFANLSYPLWLSDISNKLLSFYEEHLHTLHSIL